MTAQSMVTLYTVLTVKHGERIHVAVDGGMGRTWSLVLYGQRFQPWVVGRDEPEGCATWWGGTVRRGMFWCGTRRW